MSADVLLVSLVCHCVYRGTACAPMYCTTPMQHRASMMQVLRVMIHTTDPELHRSTISWMWDPALLINGLVVSTPPKEDAHTWTLHDSCSAPHTVCGTRCWYQCSPRPALHESVWTTRAMTALALASHLVDEYHEHHRFQGSLLPSCRW